MKTRTQFPKGRNVTMILVGVKRVFLHLDGRPMTTPEADAHAQGYIPGEIKAERTVLAHYGQSTSRHCWSMYCDDQRRNKWSMEYSDFERLWNGVLETELNNQPA